MTHASVFSGIGGPEVAATMLGWENLFHCEINPFGKRVLDYWYPNAESYDDITRTDFTKWRGRVDVFTGGFPCQPFSYAGRRRGAEDDRYLWPSMYRAIDEIQPTWVVAENVAGILTMVEQGEVSQVASPASLFAEINDVRGQYQLRETFTLQRICTDLEGHGYAVQPILIPACAVGAPHRRDRVFIVARRVTADNDVSRFQGFGRSIRQTDGTQGETRQRDGVVGNGESRTTTDPEHLRLQHDAGRGEQAADIETQSRRRQDVLSEPIQCAETVSEGRTSADTQEQSGERMRPEQSEVGRTESQESGGRGCKDGCERIPTDTDMLGRRGGWLCGDSQGHGQAEDGLSETLRSVHHDGVRRERESEVCGTRWRGFPTQSPVHRGNDGLPFDVDRLTISFGKWRTEALKAYGNAIVPQVMYEIFRAIENVEQSAR